MKMTVKEFIKLDLTSLMQVNGGTSACGNYTQTQPATPPSGGNETNNSPSNNGGGTGGSGNNTTSYSPSYSGGSTTGTSTGTCGGSGGQNKNPGGDNPSNDKPNNDTTNNNNNNNNNNNGSGGTSVGGCSSINGGNGNGDELKGKEDDDEVKNDLPENTAPAPEQPTTPENPSDPSGCDENSSNYHPEDWIVESEKGISFPLGDGNISGEGDTLDCTMTSDYGMRGPISEVNINNDNFHNGIDFAAKEGERINSVADGYITKVGYSEVLGNYVVVTHENGTSTRYAHCSDINVSVGDIVDGGQMIASVGQTGAATGPHLHLSFDANGNGSFYDEGIDDPNLLFNF